MRPLGIDIKEVEKSGKNSKTMHKLLSILITFNAFALAISAQTARTVTIKGVYQIR